MGVEPNDTPEDADPLGAFGFPNRLDRLQWISVSGSLNDPPTDRVDYYTAPVSATVGALYLSLDRVAEGGAYPILNEEVTAVTVNLTAFASGAFGAGQVNYRYSLGSSNIPFDTRFEALSLGGRLDAAERALPADTDYDTRLATLEVLGTANDFQRALTWPLAVAGDFDITAGRNGNMAVLQDLEARLESVAPGMRDDLSDYIDLIADMVNDFFTPRSSMTVTQWTGTGDDARVQRVSGDTVMLTASEGDGYVGASVSAQIGRPNGFPDGPPSGFDPFPAAFPIGYTFTIGARSTRDLYDLSGDDRFDGTARGDLLEGGAGDDVLRGLGGNDTLLGGDGDDMLDGGSGFDRLHGGDGDDLLSGLDGFDTLRGDDGRDTLYGNAGNDLLLGEEGDDLLYGGIGFDQLFGGGGDDRLFGGDGFDTLQGNAGLDTLYGNAGNDLLRGGQDDDLLYGGIGADVLYGDLGNDRLYGGNGGDLLFGGEGDDRLLGNAGNDTLDGGAGNDVLVGGIGRDTFVFGMGYGQDRIADFQNAIDAIHIDADLLGDGNPVATDLIQYAGRTAEGFVILDFGGGDTLTFTGVTNTGVILDEVVFV